MDFDSEGTCCIGACRGKYIKEGGIYASLLNINAR